MKKWDIKTRPPTDICPEQYCFCWVPPKGKADLSGRSYDSFEEAMEASNKGVIFLKGGCAYPLGLCQRETKNLIDHDGYEPYESLLRRDGLPELFFCKVESLCEEFVEEYKTMEKMLWD
jgi:hypothetical protein